MDLIQNRTRAILATSVANNSSDESVKTSPVHDRDYYGKCLAGGVISCGTTHTAITALDNAKCNMQVNPQKYSSLVGTVRTIIKEEGARALMKGWQPTFLGYSMQGAGKYGLYEVFKDKYSNFFEESTAHKYRGVIYLAASASAEFFADIALCPMEMVKVKIQTAEPGTFPTKLGPALTAMKSDPTTGFPFRSLIPLWTRQIPYTMAKFFFFEFTVEQFYRHVFTKPRETYSSTTNLGISFASGYIAGIACAVISHPADNVVSQMSKSGKSMAQILKELGPKGIWGGIGPRILMIGTLTAFQWWIYDSFKTITGIK